MSREIKKARPNLEIYQLARDLTRDCAQKDYMCEITKLHNYVRDHVRYVKDIDGMESVQSPEKTLFEIGTGDCDDKVTAMAALVQSIGHKSRSVALSMFPGVFSHVYLEVNIRGKWIPSETTEPWPIGKAPTGYIDRLIVNNW